ncbi:hypothetical protein PTTG_25862, partial [Puccinia triticina 1-1 BBBD Race 1]
SCQSPARHPSDLDQICLASCALLSGSGWPACHLYVQILQRLADSGVQSPPPNGPQRSEYTRNKFLTGLEKRINCARSNELRQEALDIIQLLEQEIVGWGFQFNLACLPGLWACSKAESLARLGKPVEADEVYYWPCAGA